MKIENITQNVFGDDFRDIAGLAKALEAQAVSIGADATILCNKSKQVMLIEQKPEEYITLRQLYSILFLTLQSNDKKYGQP